MVHPPVPPDPTPIAAPISAAPPPFGGRDIDAPALDSEAAMLLRAILFPLLDTACDWPALARGLAGKGYGLGIRRGRLVLLDLGNGRRLCSARYLGFGLRQLSARLGRPMIRPLPGRPGDGDLVAPETEPGPDVTA